MDRLTDRPTDRRTQGGGPVLRTLGGQHGVGPGARAASLAAPLKTYYNTTGSEARASTEAAAVAVALLVGGEEKRERRRERGRGGGGRGAALSDPRPPMTAVAIYHVRL